MRSATMAHRFELVVFDWDGTLMDSAAAIVAAIQEACRDLDIEPPSEAAARHVIGLGLHDALSSALPEVAPADYPRVAERYRYHYLSRDQDLGLFPGALDLIRTLYERRVLLGVATGKSRLGLDRALQTTGLEPYFHATRCADECFSKPHPAMLNEIMDLLGIAPAQTLMVGDTTHDLQMARNAGTASLAVGFGAHPAQALAVEASLGCVASVEELREWLLGLV